jgi:hypothetical protein
MARSLTERESGILDLLLSLEAPGVAELREQVPTALVVGKCRCGCASIDLWVDRNATPPSALGRRYGPAIRAITRPLPIPPNATVTGVDEKDADVSYIVTLWVDEAGWLSGVEITDLILDDPADANPFPPPEDFYPPLLEDARRPKRRRRFLWRR